MLHSRSDFRSDNVIPVADLAGGLSDSKVTNFHAEAKDIMERFMLKPAKMIKKSPLRWHQLAVQSIRTDWPIWNPMRWYFRPDTAAVKSKVLVEINPVSGKSRWSSRITLREIGETNRSKSHKATVESRLVFLEPIEGRSQPSVRDRLP